MPSILNSDFQGVAESLGEKPMSLIIEKGFAMSNKKLIFGPSIFLVSIVFTMGAAVLNAPALLIYLLTVKILYAFVVSMIVEG
ncbi:hypothetical protein [Vibrio sp. WXL103]|uniref:hypothetical protein n=1 Tax=Vibrio sp. WXL103 TaxID=3450710 RepID=UPI003EC640DF